MDTVSVTKWAGPGPPSEASLQEIMAQERLQPYSWSNGPGDVYEAHSHNYHKVIFVVLGSITFTLPATGEELNLQPGDRLDLPAGTSHGAIVGARGVTCLEAHR